MSMKFVPFTTRPLSTSRQGMTRLRSNATLPQRLDRLADREAALVQRLAGDHAGEIQQPQVAQPAQVVERGDPARVQEAAADHLGHPPHLVEVRAVEHAVVVYVRV